MASDSGNGVQKAWVFKISRRVNFQVLLLKLSQLLLAVLYIFLFKYNIFSLFYFCVYTYVISPSLSNLLFHFQIHGLFFSVIVLKSLCVYVCVPKYTNKTCLVCIMLLVCMSLWLAIWYWITNQCALPWGIQSHSKFPDLLALRVFPPHLWQCSWALGVCRSCSVGS